ncbi:hypothetical protein [Vibrio tapetis]|uniref:Putative FOG: TPR repeat protein n=1 Tax=Vibrio tapetis subsp. tapetis TaxID=1671868 RepID=A0A2N8ZAU7_9VIBR|nr:hypothetical protein [Vibrio tapetis]SON49026.1 putative FOG: TPR repeat protein [Vibrio tapetis subsp. tapetis]
MNKKVTFKTISNNVNTLSTSKINKTISKSITKHKNGKRIYLRVFDKNVMNTKGKPGKQITLASLPLDLVYIPSLNVFQNKYVTEEGKAGLYKVDDDDYRRMINILKPYVIYIKKHRAEKLHETESVVINNKPYQVSSLAAKLHHVVELIDELEHCDKQGVSVTEAQELFQAMYRIKQRLEACKLPDYLYNEYLHKPGDAVAIDRIRKKHTHKVEDKANLKRLVECYDQLTPLDIVDAEKKSKHSIKLRNRIASMRTK